MLTIQKFDIQGEYHIASGTRQIEEYKNAVKLYLRQLQIERINLKESCTNFIGNLQKLKTVVFSWKNVYVKLMFQFHTKYFNVV